MRIEPDDLELLREISRVCETCGVQWMLIGALARDVLLDRLADMSAGRATDDVDIAVTVASWNDFDALKGAFAESGLLEPTTTAHRLRGTSGGPFEARRVDVVPFGEQIQDGTMLRWPPDQTTVMSVVGFVDAFDASLEIAFDGLRFRVVSVPGLAALKLAAWLDRHHETTKDAVDFDRLLRTYEYVIGTERLYDAEIDAVELTGYDVAAAAAVILGSDVRRIASPPTLARLESLFDDDRLRSLFIDQLPQPPTPTSATTPSRSAIIEWFTHGLQKDRCSESCHATPGDSTPPPRHYEHETTSVIRSEAATNRPIGGSRDESRATHAFPATCSG